jgi:hypothetical protein
MSNDARRIIYNTRERAESDDLNNTTDLLVRQDINNLAFTSAPDAFTALNLYGVVAGLVVGSTGLSLTVVVDIGLAVKYDAPAADVYDSKYRLIEVTTPITVDVSSYVNGVNPRWIVIEVEPGSAVEAMSLRDIYNPTTSMFVPQSVPKVRKSEPVVSVTAGLAAATPVMPAGTAGKIPLAYIYLGAGALAVNPDTIVGCRPLLTARLGEAAANLTGGGFEVATDGVSVVTASSSMQFRPALFPATVSLDHTVVSIDLAAVGSDAWGFGMLYPVTTAPIYMFLMAAPYPAGYDTNLAGREFVPADQVAVAAVIPSYTAGVTGGLLVASSDPPDNLDAAIGTHVGIAVFGVNDPTWNGGPGVSALLQGRVAYVGAVSFQIGLGGLVAQRVNNRSRVRFKTTAPGDEAVVQPSGGSTFNQLGNWAFTDPLTLPAPDRWAPLTAHAFEVSWRFSWVGTNPSYVWHLSVDETPSPFVTVVSDSMIAAGAGAPTTLIREGTNVHNTGTSGACRWETTNAAGVGSTTLRARVWGYEDAMLERT